MVERDIQLPGPAECCAGNGAGARTFSTPARDELDSPDGPSQSARSPREPGAPCRDGQPRLLPRLTALTGSSSQTRTAPLVAIVHLAAAFVRVSRPRIGFDYGSWDVQLPADIRSRMASPRRRRTAVVLASYRACRTRMVYRRARLFMEVNFTSSVAFSVRMTITKGVSSPVVKPFPSLKTQLAWTSMRRFSRLRR